MNSIFPFINTVILPDQTLVQELPVFYEYAYDSEQNCLTLGEDGLPYLVEKNEALRIWIYKALSTQRFSSCAACVWISSAVYPGRRITVASTVTLMLSAAMTIGWAPTGRWVSI